MISRAVWRYHRHNRKGRSILSKPKMKPDVSPDKAALVRVALDQVKAGQTIPAEEVEAWIESWDTADELPKPKPGKR